LIGERGSGEESEQTEPSAPPSTSKKILLLFRLFRPIGTPWAFLPLITPVLLHWVNGWQWQTTVIASSTLCVIFLLPIFTLRWVAIFSRNRATAEMAINILRIMNAEGEGITRPTKDRRRIRRYLAGFSAQALTDIAAILAGDKRAALREEWRSHLAGDSGHDPATWDKVKSALGFVVSAVRFRCSDAVDATWTPIDAVLRSRSLSNLFVLIPTAAAGCLVLHHEGTLGVIDSAESIIAIAATLYGLIRTGRWWRDVKPCEPKARRPKG
jgi:hypothetical protein